MIRNSIWKAQEPIFYIIRTGRGGAKQISPTFIVRGARARWGPSRMRAEKSRQFCLKLAAKALREEIEAALINDK
jgi:hypothetical protein